MPDPPDWRLEKYESLLRLRVRQLQLDPRYRRRFDSSDLVQETLLRAQAGLTQQRGRSEGERVAWLLRIFDNLAVDVLRRGRVEERVLGLQRELSDSTQRLEAFLSDGRPAPDCQAERREELLQLAEAVERLPDEQRDAVVYRFQVGLSVAETAAAMNATERAVAGLLYRAVRRLREWLA